MPQAPAAPGTVRVRVFDAAMRRALRETIAVIRARSVLSRGGAYQLRPLAVDFRITRAVNGEKGVHGRPERGLLF